VLVPERPSLYPTKSAAGALLGQQLANRGYQSCILLGITPEGVEVAANAARAMARSSTCWSRRSLSLGSNLAPIGAMAESAPSEIDPDFQPGMNLIEKLQSAIDEARARVKQDLVLYRTQRPVKALAGRTAVVVDGQVIFPWKVLAAAKAAEVLSATRVIIATPVATEWRLSASGRGAMTSFVHPDHGCEGHPPRMATQWVTVRATEEYHDRSSGCLELHIHHSLFQPGVSP